nr:hypothetical protein [Tanacetum cinerariifolium]
PDDPMPSSIEEDDNDSRDILIREELLDNYSLPLLENESFNFDIPLSPCPPAKPPDGNTGILNIKMTGDVSDQKVPDEDPWKEHSYLGCSSFPFLSPLINSSMGGIRLIPNDIILQVFISSASIENHNESFHFDIPLSYRPPAKPTDGNTRILNIKMMGDVSDQKVGDHHYKSDTTRCGCGVFYGFGRHHSGGFRWLTTVRHPKGLRHHSSTPQGAVVVMYRRPTATTMPTTAATAAEKAAAVAVVPAVVVDSCGSEGDGVVVRWAAVISKQNGRRVAAEECGGGAAASPEKSPEKFSGGGWPEAASKFERGEEEGF